MVVSACVWRARAMVNRVSGVSVSAAGEGSEGLTVCMLWWWSTHQGREVVVNTRCHIVDPRQQWPYVGIVVVTVADLGSRSLSLSSFVQVGAIVVVVSAPPSSEIYRQG